MNATVSSDVLSLSVWGWITVGVVLGTTVTVLLLTGVLACLFYSSCGTGLLSELYARDRRNCLPRYIILVRHGESQANVDKRIWQHLPDNLVALTEKGQAQATAAGQRVAALLQQQQPHDDKPVRRIHLIVSPFERALQTAACMRPALRHLIVRTDIESRIREQEMGNLQGEAFATFRAEQTRVGRFWYRFPTGESGSDVLDRVKSWWYESVSTVNTRAGFAPVDALVVVTHGLTMRFILMQLFGWSPTTFHSVWNADNCCIYVLRRDLSKPGASPYVLDPEHGDMPRSSIDVVVQLKNSKTKLALKLQDYLSVPPPRTTRIGLIGQMLAAQYPDKIAHPDDIAAILFMPFSEGGIIKGRSTSGNLDGTSASSSSDVSASWRVTATTEYSNNLARLNGVGNHDDDSDDDDDVEPNHVQFAKPEMSLRFPCIQLPEEGVQKVESSSSAATARRFRFFQSEQRQDSSPDSLLYSDRDDNEMINYTANRDDDDDNGTDNDRRGARNLENSTEQEESNVTTNSLKLGPFHFPPLPWFGGCAEGDATKPKVDDSQKKHV